jgi:hypothetical protein
MMKSKKHQFRKMIKKKKTKAILGKPHEAKFISKACSSWNLRHGFNQEYQIQTNLMSKN